MILEKNSVENNYTLNKKPKFNFTCQKEKSLGLKTKNMENREKIIKKTTSPSCFSFKIGPRRHFLVTYLSTRSKLNYLDQSRVVRVTTSLQIF